MASYKHELQHSETLRLTASNNGIHLTLFRGGEYVDSLTADEISLVVTHTQREVRAQASTVIEVDFVEGRRRG